MKRIVGWTLAVIVAFFVVALTLANRQLVRLSLDPFAGPEAFWSIERPLYEVAFGAFLIGLLIGAAAQWFASGRHRQAARHHRSRAGDLQRELRRKEAAPPPAPPAPATAAMPAQRPQPTSAALPMPGPATDVPRIGHG